MAVLKSKEIVKMSPKERSEKLKELKMELVRANVTANKTNAKTKELKRAISRILTYSSMEKYKVNKSSDKEGELRKK
jgi:ribosomal protein L29